MDNSTVEQTPTENGKTPKGQVTVGVPYPIETIESIIPVALQLVAENGTGKPITKEAIAKAVNKSAAGLSQYFSTFVHYGIFITVHGKGYAPTELFRRYMNPVHDGDERKYMLEMFKKPSLYAKIIEEQNGHVLPTDSRRFGNMLKDEPYNVTEYASERAARIFLENAKNLGLMDANNTFRINGSTAPSPQPSKEVKEDAKPTHNPKPPEPELFELPIPLSGNRRAKLFYPLENLTKKDIRVIAKALAYIASTVLDEKEAAEAEKEIQTEVFDNS